MKIVAVVVLIAVNFWSTVTCDKSLVEDGTECNRQNGGCAQQCTQTEGSYRCSCFPGFSLTRNGRNCEDVNECMSENGGCQHTCTNIIGSYECSCMEDYVLSSNGHTCIPRDPMDVTCLSTENGCQHNCTTTSEGHICTCRAGYRLHHDKKSCIRLCTYGNGGCQHKCIDRDRRGTFCKCQKNYVLQLDGKSCVENRTWKSLTTSVLERILFRSPRAASSCAVDNGGCYSRCEPTPIGAQCSCPEGFNPHSDRRSCEDIDECIESNGNCHHLCRNSQGSYQCSCNKGYMLAPDEKTCLDMNECKMNDTCSHTCINLPGSFLCECPAGYQKFAVTRCGDIDECAVNNGGCAHSCSNVIGSFECSCEKDFHLHWNKKDCLAELCHNNQLKDDGGELDCSPRSKTCSLTCPRKYFEANAVPERFKYACGPDTKIPLTSKQKSKYQWLTSELDSNISTPSCTGGDDTSNMIRHKVTKFKVTAKHCNLDLSSKITSKASSSDQKTTIASVIVNCEPTKRRRRPRSLITVEMEIFVKKPKLTRKCNAKCVEKKLSKMGRSVTKYIKRSINKQKFFLRFTNDDIKVLKKGNAGVLTSTGCAVGHEIRGNRCVKCRAGTRLNITTNTCIDCRDGFYQDKEGQLDCLPCPSTVAHISSFPTKPLKSVSQCSGICAPGHFSPDGFSSCHPCPIGSYQPEHGRTSCYLCGTGIATARTGAVTFKECQVRGQCSSGHFYDIRVSTCLRCPIGFYQPNTGQNYCYRCPENTTTDFDGSTNTESCKNSTCGGIISEFQGIIESPNYPGNYPNNVHCQWNIIPPRGRKILLVIPEIHLVRTDNCGDIVVMRKSASTSSILTYEACQSFENPIALTPLSKRLWIEFSSDGQNSAKGFQIPYVTYDENYDAIIKDIVSDGRLYSINYHQKILKDKQSRQTLFEVLAHPQKYFVLRKENFRGLFPQSFIKFLKEKVIKFLKPVTLN